ncbi:MAG: hypothetical protein V8R23_10215 [Alphaproteobacteria bacterium]|jgi:hypothetical protein
MKRSVILLPFLLSGCFMYNNLKCSFTNTCVGYGEEQEQKASQAAESLLHTRCSMLGLKRGTDKYIDCRTKHDRVYNEDVNAYGVVEAYMLLQANYQSWQTTCEKYGTKVNTSAYNRCFNKQEETYVNQRKEDYEFQKALALRPVINTYTTSTNTTTFY